MPSKATLVTRSLVGGFAVCPDCTKVLRVALKDTGDVYYGTHCGWGHEFMRTQVFVSWSAAQASTSGQADMEKTPGFLDDIEAEED